MDESYMKLLEECLTTGMHSGKRHTSVISCEFYLHFWIYQYLADLVGLYIV